jgi:hypothetical protein
LADAGLLQQRAANRKRHVALCRAYRSAVPRQTKSDFTQADAGEPAYFINRTGARSQRVKR